MRSGAAPGSYLRGRGEARLQGLHAHRLRLRSGPRRSPNRRHRLLFPPAGGDVPSPRPDQLFTLQTSEGVLRSQVQTGTFLSLLMGLSHLLYTYGLLAFLPYDLLIQTLGPFFFYLFLFLFF